MKQSEEYNPSNPRPTKNKPADDLEDALNAFIARASVLKRYPTTKDDKGYKKPENVLSIVTILLTSIAVVTTVIGAGFAGGAYYASKSEAQAGWAAATQAKRQADIAHETMNYSTRPWVKTTITLSYIAFSDWVGSKQVDVDITAKVENYGQSVARNVVMESRVVIDPGNPKRAELDPIQTAECKKAQTTAESNTIGGTAVFPGDTAILWNNEGIPDNGQPTVFSILGCIDYTFGNGEHGQTGFRMVLGMAQNNLIVGIPFVDGLPHPYQSTISPQLLAHGYPVKPPNVAEINPKTLFFAQADTGNYAK